MKLGATRKVDSSMDRFSIGTTLDDKALIKFQHILELDGS